MFRNKYQSGLLSVLYSCGKSPLELWGMHVKNGFIRRVTDDEVKSLALEIAGTNVTTTYIYSPSDPKKVLAIRLPFLVMIIKNLKKYFTFEITVLDDKNMRRRFRFSNFQSATRIRPFCTSMPIGLPDGWNQIQFNLVDFTRRAYGTNYVETTRMQIHANCRIRRIYFADRLYTNDELPEEYKLFLPTRRKSCVREEPSAEKEPSVELSAEPPDFEAEVPEEEEEEALYEEAAVFGITPSPAPSDTVHEEDYPADIPEAPPLEEEIEDEREIVPDEDAVDRLGASGPVTAADEVERVEEDEEHAEDVEEQYENIYH